MDRDDVLIGVNTETIDDYILKIQQIYSDVLYANQTLKEYVMQKNYSNLIATIDNFENKTNFSVNLEDVYDYFNIISNVVKYYESKFSQKTIFSKSIDIIPKNGIEKDYLSNTAKAGEQVFLNFLAKKTNDETVKKYGGPLYDVASGFSKLFRMNKNLEENGYYYGVYYGTLNTGNRIVGEYMDEYSKTAGLTIGSGMSVAFAPASGGLTLEAYKYGKKGVDAYIDIKEETRVIMEDEGCSYEKALELASLRYGIEWLDENLVGTIVSKTLGEQNLTTVENGNIIFTDEKLKDNIWFDYVTGLINDYLFKGSNRKGLGMPETYSNLCEDMTGRSIKEYLANEIYYDFKVIYDNMTHKIDRDIIFYGPEW